MRYRIYKNTGLTVSEVGFGLWTISTGWWGNFTEGELARNHRLGEVTFADKIRIDINFANGFRIEQKNRVAQARFFFPERAPHVCKKFASPNLRRMRQRRRARIWIDRRTVRDN